MVCLWKKKEGKKKNKNLPLLKKINFIFGVGGVVGGEEGEVGWGLRWVRYFEEEKKWVEGLKKMKKEVGLGGFF